MESSSSSVPSKKGKGLNNIRNAVSCLVDGCNSDLSQYREYHRRHKVCEFHSKTPKVTIGGREQRFCQQCSRFHSLKEFDEAKRSCRKRLDIHNRRRRKPPPESLTISPGRFLPNQQGTTSLSFSTTEQLPSPTGDSSWAIPLKLENNVGDQYYNTHSFEEQNQFKIISESDFPISEPLFSNHGFVSGISNQYNDNDNDNFTRVVNPDCALSLLSSATTTETRGSFENSPPSFQFCERQNNNIHCYGFFHNGPSSSSPGPILSFKWE